MMLGLVVGGVAIAVVLYDLWTRNQTPPPPQLSASSLRTLSPSGPTPDKVRAAVCGLQPFDWAATDAWTLQYFGPSMALTDRLKLMRSVQPYALWPTSAKRVYCTYVDQTVAVPAPTQFASQGVTQHWHGL